MIKRYQVLFSLFILFIVPIVVSAQITISSPDVEAVYPSAIWVTLSDTIGGSQNLGSASSSAQSWDFSTIPVASAARKDTALYQLPAGHLEAGQFPDADFCGTTVLTTYSGPYTISTTFIFYSGSITEGAYLFGSVIRQQFSPSAPDGYPIDTTIALKYRTLSLPLPLTLNTTRTETDTIPSTDGKFEVDDLTYDANGFGTMVFPGGATKQVIRVVETKVRTRYSSSWSFQDHQKTKHVRFYAKDLTQLSFQVDTLYNDGASTVKNYAVNKQAGILGVREISNVQPQSFSLEQNYPNPFNPYQILLV